MFSSHRSWYPVIELFGKNHKMFLRILSLCYQIGSRILDNKQSLNANYYLDVRPCWRYDHRLHIQHDSKLNLQRTLDRLWLNNSVENKAGTAVDERWWQNVKSCLLTWKPTQWLPSDLLMIKGVVGTRPHESLTVGVPSSWIWRPVTSLMRTTFSSQYVLCKFNFFNLRSTHVNSHLWFYQARFIQPKKIYVFSTTLVRLIRYSPLF